MCSLKKCNYVLKRILVFPKEMLFLGTNWSSAGVVFSEEMVVCPHKCNHVPKEMLDQGQKKIKKIRK